MSNPFLIKELSAWKGRGFFSHKKAQKAQKLFLCFLCLLWQILLSDWRIGRGRLLVRVDVNRVCIRVDVVEVLPGR
jgi:hypothetical protein